MEQKYSSNSVLPEFFEMEQIQIEGNDKIVQNSCTKKWNYKKCLHLLKGNIYVLILALILGIMCVAMVTSITSICLELEKKENQYDKLMKSSAQKVAFISDQSLNNTAFLESKISRSNEDLVMKVKELERSIRYNSRNLNDLSSSFKRHREVNINATLKVSGALMGSHPSFPAPSCAAIKFTSPLSGYYWLSASNGSTILAYCYMTLTCGSVTGGWIKVANLDMTVGNARYPSNLCSNQQPVRTCRICSDSGTCSSDIFEASINYSTICGRIRGYQVGTPDAFTSSLDIDGVMLSHGHPKKLIWAFAAAPLEGPHSQPSCPCIDRTDSTIPSSPSFFGNNYFCDTGTTTQNHNAFYIHNPLWDGAGCGGNNACCSFNHGSTGSCLTPLLTT